MLAYAQESSLKCSSCGTSNWEWDEKEGGNRYAYEPMFVTCPGCQRRELLTKDGTARGPGTTVTLIPRDTASKMRERLALETERRALIAAQEAE